MPLVSPITMVAAKTETCPRVASPRTPLDLIGCTLMRLRVHFLVTAGMQLLTVLMAAARTVLYGNLFGAGAATDAYYNAFLWFRVFLEDMPTLLLPALLPWYTQMYSRSDRDTARSAFMRCVIGRGVGFIAFVAVLAILSPSILSWTGSKLSPEARQLALQLMLAFLAISPGLFLAAMYRMHLESQHRFAVSGLFRTLLWGWSIIALTAAPWIGIWAMVVGPGIGVASGVILLHAVYVRDLRNKSDRVAESAGNPGADPSLPELKISNLSLSTMFISIALQRAAGFLELHFSSQLPPGAFTLYTTVGTLVSLPVVLLVQSLTTVVTPGAAHWRATGRVDLMRAMLPRLVALVIAASSGAAVVTFLASDLLIRLLFSHGSLDAGQLEAMSQVLRYFSLTIVLLSVQNALSSLTATLGGFYILVILPALALLAHYLLLASYGDRLSLLGLVYGKTLYHTVWAVGLVAYIGFWIRAVNPTGDAGVPQLDSTPGA